MQAKTICPSDPLVYNELGVVAYDMKEYLYFSLDSFYIYIFLHNNCLKFLLPLRWCFIFIYNLILVQNRVDHLKPSKFYKFCLHMIIKF